jgi:hypothetical protein
VRVRRSGLAPVKINLPLEIPSEDSAVVADLLHFYAKQELSNYCKEQSLSIAGCSWCSTL